MTRREQFLKLDDAKKINKTHSERRAITIPYRERTMKKKL